MDRIAVADRDARIIGFDATHRAVATDFDARLLDHMGLVDAHILAVGFLRHDLLLGRTLVVDDRPGLRLVVLDRGDGAAAVNLHARLVLHGAAMDGHAGALPGL